MEHLEIVGQQNSVVLSSSTVGENNNKNINLKAYSFVCFLRQFTDILFFFSNLIEVKKSNVSLM